MSVRGKWVFRDGHFVSVEKRARKASVAPVIHQDTLKEPLFNHATGKMAETKSEFRRSYKEQGLEEVGNELLTKNPNTRPELIPDEKIRDAIERAAATLDNPDKRREYEGRERERIEQLQRFRRDQGLI